MSDETRAASGGSTDGSDDLADLIAEVDRDHGAEGAGAMADRLRDRTEETKADREEPGDLED